jgi:beta-glucosidase
VVQPVKSLRAFQRVILQSGESKHVQFTLPASQLAFYDVKTKSFTVEPGAFNVLVGSSSEDIRARTQLTVAGTKKQ